jgi:hypothetical protein
VGPDRRPEPLSVGSAVPIARPNPNARFANLTPEQRVQQARRHFQEFTKDVGN